MGIPCGYRVVAFARVVSPVSGDRSNVCCDAGFTDALRDVWVARIVAWRRRSAQAGNRGVGLGGWVVMGICRPGLAWGWSDTLVERLKAGQFRHQPWAHFGDLRRVSP